MRSWLGLSQARGSREETRLLCSGCIELAREKGDVQAVYILVCDPLPKGENNSEDILGRMGEWP